MNDLLFSLNAVFPLFLLMALGYILRIRKVLDLPFYAKANKATFRVLLPVMLFVNIYDLRSSDTAVDWQFLAISAVGVIAVTLLFVLIVPRLSRNPQKTGALIQGMYRSNFLLFGIPMVVNMFGEAQLGPASMLMPVSIPIYNVLAVIILSIFGPQRQQGGRVRATLIDIAKNPLIIASLAAIALLVLHIELPVFLYSGLRQIGVMATPLALLALGGTLEFGSLRKNLGWLAAACAGKLLIVPAIMMPVVIAFGYRGSYVAAMLSLFASPTAVSSYVMAVETGNDGELAGQIVAVGTAVSVVTMFFWILALRVMGFL